MRPCLNALEKYFRIAVFIFSLDMPTFMMGRGLQSNCRFHKICTSKCSMWGILFYITDMVKEIPQLMLVAIQEIPNGS